LGRLGVDSIPEWLTPFLIPSCPIIVCSQQFVAYKRRWRAFSFSSYADSILEWLAPLGELRDRQKPSSDFKVGQRRAVSEALSDGSTCAGPAALLPPDPTQQHRRSRTARWRAIAGRPALAAAGILAGSRVRLAGTFGSEPWLHTLTCRATGTAQHDRRGRQRRGCVFGGYRPQQGAPGDLCPRAAKPPN
jgi:hypothetical protein